MAACDTLVEGSVVSFMCDLPANHEGPHRAIENDRSVRERRRWEADQRTPDQRHADSGLEEFQGRAQTTAERYTENPTPVPGPKPEPEQVEEDYSEQERPIVYTEAAEGTAFRHATSAEAKAAGVGAESGYPLRGHPTSERCRGTVMTDSGPVPCPAFLCHDGEGGVFCPGYLGHEEERGLPDPDEDMHVEPTKVREGDQPLPEPTQGEYVQDRIIDKIERLRGTGAMSDEQADILIKQMEESKSVGTQRYGTPLQTFNGRDALQDLADELRDGYVYVNSLMQAREAQRGELVEVVRQAIETAYADDGNGGRYEVLSNADFLARCSVDAILKATGGFGT